MMGYLSDRYVKVYTYRNIAICLLKVAVPSEGDELGFRIDDERFKDIVFDNPDDAVKAIDSLFLMSEDNNG